MAHRIMWGTDSDQALAIDPDALERAEQSEAGFAFLDAGEVGEAPAGPMTEAEGGPVPATRLVYLLDDDGGSRPIAVSSERVAGNADVLAAVEEEWKERSGDGDVRVDAPPVTSEEQAPASGSAPGL